MPNVHIDRLTKRYGDVAAVDELSFVAREGAVTGFLGPNGAGKTTTLRMLLGLVTPTGGTATIDGVPYARARRAGAARRRRPRVQLLPPRPPRAQPPARARRRGDGIPQTRVDEVLELVGLGDVGHRRVKGFSLGMRQRLGLAGALLGDPQVLILDEPANGLDPEGVHWLRGFLRTFADRGGTVIVSSHLLAEVAQTVDDVVIIARGRLVAQAPLAELTRALAGRACASARRSPTRCARRSPRRTSRSSSSGPTPSSPWTPRPRRWAWPPPARAIVIYEMATEHLDLEDLFLDLTATAEATR